MASWIQTLFGNLVGSGVLASQSRAVHDFDQVELTGSGMVTITQTGEESLTVEAEDNILPLVTTELRGHRLVLGTRSGAHFHSTLPVRYTITVRQLRGIFLSGSGRVQVATLNTDVCETRISGSGDVEITGQTPRQSVGISGSGAYRAEGFASGAAEVRVSGSGNATLNARERLDIHISGSGTVRYVGQPHVTRSITGSGRVRPVN